MSRDSTAALINGLTLAGAVAVILLGATHLTVNRPPSDQSDGWRLVTGAALPVVLAALIMARSGWFSSSPWRLAQLTTVAVLTLVVVTIFENSFGNGGIEIWPFISGAIYLGTPAALLVIVLADDRDGRIEVKLSTAWAALLGLMAFAVAVRASSRADESAASWFVVAAAPASCIRASCLGLGRRSRLL